MWVAKKIKYKWIRMVLILLACAWFQCFWAMGACFEVALALAVAPTLGWRWLLGLSALPLFVFACITPVRMRLISTGHQSIRITFKNNIHSYFSSAVVARISSLPRCQWASGQSIDNARKGYSAITFTPTQHYMNSNESIWSDFVG